MGGLEPREKRAPDLSAWLGSWANPHPAVSLALERLNLASGPLKPPCSRPLLLEQKVLFCNLLKSVFSSRALWPGETFSDGCYLGCGSSWSYSARGIILPCPCREQPGSVVSGQIKREEREGWRDAGRAQHLAWASRKLRPPHPRRRRENSCRIALQLTQAEAFCFGFFIGLFTSTMILLAVWMYVSVKLEAIEIQKDEGAARQRPRLRGQRGLLSVLDVAPVRVALLTSASLCWSQSFLLYPSVTTALWPSMVGWRSQK